jgi:hypothetical protein
MPRFNIFTIFIFFWVLFIFSLAFIDIRKIVMFFTPNFILFNDFLVFPMIYFVSIIDVFKRKNDIVIEVIKNFRKVGKIRKVGWSWGEEYYLFFHIKNFKQKIMVVIETNGSWQLIPQRNDHYPNGFKYLNSVGIKNYSGTFEDILKIAEEGKFGALVNKL